LTGLYGFGQEVIHMLVLNSHGQDRIWNWLSIASKAYSDGRSRRVIGLLLVMLLLSAIDLGITLDQMTTVGMLEQSPFAHAVVKVSGTSTSLIFLKTISLIVNMGILCSLRHRWQAEVGVWVGLGILCWLMVRWSLYLQIMVSIDAELLSSLAKQSEWLAMN
jgi:hypothetical protein